MMIRTLFLLKSCLSFTEAQGALKAEQVGDESFTLKDTTVDASLIKYGINRIRLMLGIEKGSNLNFYLD